MTSSNHEESDDLLWDSDIMYDSERNYSDTCDYCFDEAPFMWEAGAVLSQLECHKVQISGKPKLVAAHGAYNPGFMGIWMYTKDGESGSFDANQLSDHVRRSLIEHLFSNMDRPRKLGDNPPFGLRSAMELAVDIRVDKAIVSDSEKEVQVKDDGLGREKDNSGKGKTRKTTKAVKMVFHWETSPDPLPSKAFQNWGK